MPIALDIILPSYNSKDTILVCLEALVAECVRCRQSEMVSDIQIYIVDDGSTDNSPRLISQFSSDIPITLLSQTKQGPSSARNLGAKQGTAPWLLFVDSDVEIEIGTLGVLVDQAIQHPTNYAFNGFPGWQVPKGTWTTQYTNLSLCYQLQQHGTLVNTAFTSLCLMRRKAWQEMDGWDTSRTSRYSDDIQSRWYFPPESIQQVFSATFVHHKHVSLFGLCKHRFNLGYHYRSSLSNTQSPTAPKTLHTRYPINVGLAGYSVLALLCLVFNRLVNFGLPLSLWTGIAISGLVGLCLNNWGLYRFTHHKSSAHSSYSLTVFGLSYLEGLCMGFGLLFSLFKPSLKDSHDT